MSNTNDFVIKDGTLVEYRGKDRNIIVPEGVKRIETYSGPFKSLSAADFDSLTLPDSLEEFSLKVFDYDYAEKNVFADKFTDANGLVIIGSWLVGYRGKQDTVMLPEQIRHISIDAFGMGSWDFNGWENQSVKKLILNEGIEEIGEEAFMESKVEAVVLPKSLKRIAADAFRGCDKLAEINLDDSVEVDPLAFLGCEKLTDERGLLVIDGKLVAVDVRKNIRYFLPDSDDFILTIPEDVIEVCDVSENLNYCFESMDGFIVTDRLQKIDPEAFSYICGINCFRIVDHATGSILFESAYGAEVYDDESEDLGDDEAFLVRCENVMEGIEKN